MNGRIKIEFVVEGSQLKIMLNAPLDTEHQRALAVQVLSGAIPIALNFRPSVIKPVNGNGAPVITKPN